MHPEREPDAQAPGSLPGWRDDPITELGQDRLNRATFAENAARLISENHSAESSVVYGLEGPWGGGKTSVIALITTSLASPPDSPWRVVPFTPWATTGTEGLLAEFFAALSTAAPQAAGGKRLRDRITAYADIARPIAAVIPIVGGGIVEASRTVEEQLRKPWNVAFAEVAAELRRVGTPILVVVDDIDRLQPVELLDLLRVVRLLGRFPGVDFLLAYDEQTLVETLQNPARGRVSTVRARAFMEKIVQYPLSMPPLLTGKIVKMLDTGLAEIVSVKRVESSFDKHRFGPVILTTMPSQLTTPRAIERFLAQVREQFRIHDLDEVNDVDLILATFLRVQFPDLFAQLQRWKPELTRGSMGRLTFGLRDVPTPNWDKLLRTVANKHDRKDAHVVLQALFPAVSERTPARAGAGRFAHPDYFDRYLAQTIPEGDIPDYVIARALAEAATGDSSGLRALITAEDDEQVTLALNKINARYPDIDEPWARGNTAEGPVTTDLLAAVMRHVAELEDRLTSLSSAFFQTTRWAANLLRLVLDSDPNASVDAALAACSQTQRRAHVVWAATTRRLDNVRPETQQALRAALRREAERLLPILLADLRRRDESDGDTGDAFLYELLEEAGLLPELQSAVGEGLQAADYSLEDVAARFVGFSYTIGGSSLPSSVAFNGAIFTRITGVDAESVDGVERGQWTDTGWPARRRFAAEHIHIAQESPS